MKITLLDSATFEEIASEPIEIMPVKGDFIRINDTLYVVDERAFDYNLPQEGTGYPLIYVFAKEIEGDYL